MPVADFTDFADKQTLVLKVPPYEEGEPLEGDVQFWKVPPLAAGTEFAVRRFQTDGLKLLEAVDKDGGTSVEFRQLGDYWAPIIAVCVRDPILDEHELKRHYPGQLLRGLGQLILQHFLFGNLPEEEGQQGTEDEAPMENRAQRRARAKK